MSDETVDCASVIARLDAWLDRELDVEQMRRIEHHINCCAACSNAASERQAVEVDLRRIYGSDSQLPEPQLQRIMTAVHAACSPPDSYPGRGESRRAIEEDSQTNAIQQEASDKTQPDRPGEIRFHGALIPWWSLLVATAAGFLIAWLTLPAPDRDEPLSQVTTPASEAKFGQITLATGPLRARMPGASKWDQFDSNSELLLGCEIQTDGSMRCRVINQTGSSFVFDELTGAQLSQENQIGLREGRVWVRAGQQEAIEIKLEGCSVLTRGSCDMQAEKGEAKLIALDAPVTVKGDGWEKVIPAGSIAFIDNADAIDEQSTQIELLLATTWIQDVLSHRTDGEELTRRVRALCETLGEESTASIGEGLLRTLGDEGVPPMATMLLDPSDFDSQQRRRIADVLADVASYRNVPTLIELLTDRDPYVVDQLQQGLKRITGYEPLQLPTKARSPQQHWQYWYQQLRPDSPSLPLPSASRKKA